MEDEVKSEDQATESSQPTATDTPPADAEQPTEGEQKSTDGEDSDEPTEEERELAKDAVKRLAQIGSILKGGDKSEEPKEEQAQVVKDLLTAAEGIEEQKLRLNKSDYATVARIHNALNSILAQAGVQGVDPNAAEKDGDEGGEERPVDTDTLAKAIAENLGEQLASLVKGQEGILNVFNESFGDMVNKTAEGLEGMASAFKQYVDDKFESIREEFSGVSKSTDDRIHKLEKSAGVSQRITGAATDVVTGDASASTKQAVEKSTDPKATRKPDGQNVWRGMFDSSVKQQLARSGRR